MLILPVKLIHFPCFYPFPILLVVFVRIKLQPSTIDADGSDCDSGIDHGLEKISHECLFELFGILLVCTFEVVDSLTRELEESDVATGYFFWRRVWGPQFGNAVILYDEAFVIRLWIIQSRIPVIEKIHIYGYANVAW